MSLRAIPKPVKTPKKQPKPLQRRKPLNPVRKGREPKRSTLKAYRKKPAPATAAQKARWEAMKALGCIACRAVRMTQPNESEIHHLNEGGQAGRKRRGHDETVCLCAWHHRGVLPAGESARFAEWSYGPSLARASKEFRRTFGTDDQLLQQPNELINGGGQ